MARYIDADKLCEGLKSMASVQEPYKQNTILGVVSTIENCPTADVAPRAEVDEALSHGYELGKREVARGILQEVRQALLNMLLSNALGQNFDLEKVFAEIEKKYTGESP